MEPQLTILICLLFAYLVSELFRFFSMPRAIGQLCAGIILGIEPVKSLVFDDSSIKIVDFLSNLGIILLFYYVGLELNFREFKKHLKQSFVISIFNTSLPLILGFLIMRYVFGYDLVASLIVGISLAVSAQSVSADILEELKLLKSKLGNMIISAGAVDDAVELILVTIILSIFQVMVINVGIASLIVQILLFIIFILFIRLIFVPFTLRIFDREKSSTTRFMGSMIIVLLIVSFSEFVGVGFLLGAMIAGIIVRQTIALDDLIPHWEMNDIAKSTHIISFGLLIPLFFVSVGINIDYHDIFTNWQIILLFLAIAVVTTVLGTIIAFLFLKKDWKEGLIVGWGLTPKGDVELVIITIAVEAGIIEHKIFTSLVMMSLLTTVISSVIFKRLVIKYKETGKLPILA